MRNLTIKQRLKQLKRRYSKVTAYKFFYNNKREIKGKYRAIHAWFLIQDRQEDAAQSRGFSIFPFDVQRKAYFTIKEWKRLFKHPYKGYESIYAVFTQAVLPAINNRSGANWTFVSLIGWAAKDDLPKDNDTNKRRKHKATKKRNANARNSNRRRHGDSTR